MNGLLIPTYIFHECLKKKKSLEKVSPLKIIYWLNGWEHETCIIVSTKHYVYLFIPLIFLFHISNFQSIDIIYLKIKRVKNNRNSKVFLFFFKQENQRIQLQFITLFSSVSYIYISFRSFYQFIAIPLANISNISMIY